MSIRDGNLNDGSGCAFILFLITLCIVIGGFFGWVWGVSCACLLFLVFSLV